MTLLAKQAAKVVDHLPREKAQAVIDFAHYLAEQVEDEAWTHRVTGSKYAKKFKAFLKTVDRRIARGEARPLQFDR